MRGESWEMPSSTPRSWGCRSSTGLSLRLLDRVMERRTRGTYLLSQLAVQGAGGMGACCGGEIRLLISMGDGLRWVSNVVSQG